MGKKQTFKRLDKHCLFCDESDYNLLDCHRIVEGKDGGQYVIGNIVTACATCHRKIHSGRIKILGKHFSTAGLYIVNYIEDEKEHWKWID